MVAVPFYNKLINTKDKKFLKWILKADFAYRELAQPMSKLNDAHIRSPRPSPIVFTIGTTVILPIGNIDTNI